MLNKDISKTFWNVDSQEKTVPLEDCIKPQEPLETMRETEVFTF